MPKKRVAQTHEEKLIERVESALNMYGMMVDDLENEIKTKALQLEHRKKFKELLVTLKEDLQELVASKKQ